MQLPKAGWSSPCLDKLEPLGWSHGFCIELPQGTVGVRTDDENGLELLYNAALAYRTGPCSRNCDSLISFRMAKPSRRRGTRNYNILYNAHIAVVRSLDIEPILDGFQVLLKWVSVRLGNPLLRIGGMNSLLSWNDERRLLCLVGDENVRHEAVLALRDHAMPSLNEYTSFTKEGLVPFTPRETGWLGKTLHPLRTLTDFVFLDSHVEEELSASQALLRLYQASWGKIPLDERIPYLAAVLKGASYHQIRTDNIDTIGERIIQQLGLEANTVAALK